LPAILNEDGEIDSGSSSSEYEDKLDKVHVLSKLSQDGTALEFGVPIRFTVK